MSIEETIVARLLREYANDYADIIYGVEDRLLDLDEEYAKKIVDAL
jgi:hypothetical protein